MNKIIKFISCLVCLTTLVGCSNTNTTDSSKNTNSGNSSNGGVGVDSGHEGHDHNEHVDSDAGYLHVDEQVKAEALASCDRAMRAFASPDLPKDQWDEGLEPLMTRDAWEVYSYTDPLRVPVKEVKNVELGHVYSDGRLVDCLVATDLGDYTVSVARASADSPWLASGFMPPEDVR